MLCILVAFNSVVFNISLKVTFESFSFTLSLELNCCLVCQIVEMLNAIREEKYLGIIFVSTDMVAPIKINHRVFVNVSACSYLSTWLP